MHAGSDALYALVDLDTFTGDGASHTVEALAASITSPGPKAVARYFRAVDACDVTIVTTEGQTRSYAGLLAGEGYSVQFAKITIESGKRVRVGW